MTPLNTFFPRDGPAVSKSTRELTSMGKHYCFFQLSLQAALHRFPQSLAPAFLCQNLIVMEPG